jgi:hypothetical protein
MRAVGSAPLRRRAAAGAMRADGRARRRRRHAARFAAALDALFAPRPGLAALPAPDTVLCRCEDVTAAEVDAAGALDLAELKSRTRCGQGPCQGRVCAALVASRLPGAPEPLFSVRPPLRPVPLGALLEVEA